MKGGFFCWALVMTIAAAGSAAAQEGTEARVAAVGPRVDTVATAPTAPELKAPPVRTPSVGSAEPISVGVRHIASTTLQTTQEEVGGPKEFFFGSRRRTSNTLMIGGVGVALLGVGVVKGHPGAILGVAGLLTSIGGLYLAF